MTQKTHHRIKTAVLLLLSLLTLAAASIAAVFAADPPETRNLTVKYDTQYCSVSYSVGGVEQGALQNGQLVQIAYRSENVKVTVTPMPGYELQAIYKVAADGSETMQQIDMQSRSYLHDFFNEDVTLRVECKPKTYNVVFVPVEGETSISYNFVTQTPEKYQNNLTYTYAASAVEIDPVEKRSGGYTFLKWEVVNLLANGSYEAISTLPVDANNKLIIPAETTILEQWQATGTIYLRPIFQPVEYDVYRYDYIVKFNPANPDVPVLDTWLNSASFPSWKAPMATEASGAWQTDEVSPYPGYRFYGFTTVKVDVDSSKNIVYRYFVPIEYALSFDWNGGSLLSGSEPTHHVYDAETALPSGQRTGYTFAGWSVLVNGVEVERVTDLNALVLSAKQEKYAQGNDAEDARKLTLKAIWEPNRYPLIYDLAGALPEDNAELPTEFIFNQSLNVPTPVRPGYSFLGWTVNGTEWTPSADAPTLVLKAGEYTDAISLKAHWEAIEYTVILDGKGGFPDSQNVKVTFGQALNTEGISIPIRAQYRFLGYFYGEKQYIAADGSSLCEAWDIATVLPTLEARWELLPMLEVNIEDYKVNYPSETFVFPNGSYTLIVGEEKISFTVTNGQTPTIPNAFFGNTVQLVVHSDGVVYSDFHGTLVLAARPAAPVWSVNGEIQSVSAPDDNSLKVSFNEGFDIALYEFALSMDGGQTMMRDWQSSPEFFDLYPGTVYELYVRVRATETTPSGEIACFSQKTDSLAFINELMTELANIVRDDDGEMLRKLIEDAQIAVQALKPHTPTFYADAEKIMTTVKEQVPFARLQDAKIAALKAYLQELLSTNAYSTDNAALLQTICNEGVALIKSASTQEAVTAEYDAAYARLSEVKITYLNTGELHVTVPGGLDKDTVLTSVRYPDLLAQIQSFDNAVAAGKVTYNGTGIAPDELIRLLSTQEVVGAYSLKLSINGATLSGIEGGLTVRLLLPEELRKTEGLRVAYYDQATGALLVLEARTDGDYLIFEADAASDFLILGDPVLNLTAPIVALSIVALCQIAAIALILISRQNAKKTIRNYAVWLPTALTVQFMPQNGEIAVLCLGILVVLLQIVLLVLLLGSEVIHRSFIGRRDERSDAASEESPYADLTASAPLQEAEEASAEDAAEEGTEAPDDADGEYAAAYAAMASAAYEDTETELSTESENANEPSAFGFELANEEGLDGVEDEEPSFEALDAENEDGYYDFIDPAPATEYSLADDEYPTAESEEDFAESEPQEPTAAVYYDYAQGEGEEAVEEISPDELTYAEEESYAEAEPYEESFAYEESEEVLAEEASLEETWDDPYADAQGFEAEEYYEEDPSEFAQGESAPYEEEYPAYEENASYEQEYPVYEENTAYEQENAEYADSEDTAEDTSDPKINY